MHAHTWPGIDLSGFASQFTNQNSLAAIRFSFFYRPKLRCTGYAYRYVQRPFCTVCVQFTCDCCTHCWLGSSILLLQPTGLSRSVRARVVDRALFDFGHCTTVALVVHDCPLCSLLKFCTRRRLSLKFSFLLSPSSSIQFVFVRQDTVEVDGS